MSVAIHKVKVREKLAPRREPYWAAPLATGRYIGYRKMPHPKKPDVVTSETWIARARDEENGGQRYNALGALSETFDYEAARKAAAEWFAALDAGVRRTGTFTVEDACKDYVEDRRREKGEKTAKDAEWRFKHTVYGTAFGATDLARLRTPAIKAWRDGLKITKSGANRMMTTLRAALNLAVENSKVSPAAAQAWGKVKQYEGADNRREIYLDVPQRRALLAAATGGVRDLIEAALLTGARPGELASALRSAFDSRTKMLTLRGKTGTRTIPLSPAAVTLFERLSKSKLPTAALFTRDDGKAWQRAEWTELVRAAAEAARIEGVPAEKAKLPAGVCLYSCRHTYITQAIGDGLTTLEVARFTGTSLAMIEKHYGHLVPASAERVAKVQML
jgi:integrase